MNNYKSHEYTYQGTPSNIVAAAPKIAVLAEAYEAQTGSPIVVKAEHKHTDGHDYLSFRATNIEGFQRIKGHTIKFSGSSDPEHEEITKTTLTNIKLEALVLNHSDS